MNKETHRFEDDLAVVTKLKENSAPMLRLFFRYYKEYEKVSKMNGNAFANPEEMVKFIMNNSKKIEEMFSIIDAAVPFNYTNLNYTINDFCIKTGADVKMFKYIECKEDITNLFKSIVIGTNYKVLKNKQYPDKIEIYTYIICATIKMYLDTYAQKLDYEKTFLDEVYNPFRKYCDLITKKENVPDSLVEKIVKFINDNRYSLKDKNATKEEYIKEFKVYTDEFNLMVEKAKQRIVKPVYYTKSVKRKSAVNKVSYVTDEIIYEKKRIQAEADKKDQEEIDKWVSSFLDVICTIEDTSDLKSQLPPPYLKNYDKIMDLLLSGFDERCKDKGKTTMNDVIIYTQLQEIVESLKK